ncbi:MAG TPA: methionine--tRNA ligase subunit beta, partial [Rudaea sp.]
GDFADLLRDWLGGKLTRGHAVMHSSVAAKLREWLDAEGGVRDWDISRDAPYFGFPIPDAPGKFFYVWLDAPIGYLASFKKYCASAQGAKNGLNAGSFDAFLRARTAGSDDGTEMHHFIGKDIVNFHGLFWPAMLNGAQWRTPDALHVNGYLMVNGDKMSKSRGTFVMARTYLDSGLNPEYLRYYFATMLSPDPTDVDLDLKTFVDVVNSHIVGKYVNIASRAGKILGDQFDGRLARFAARAEKTHELIAAEDKQTIPQLYREGRYSAATVRIVALADKINEFLQQQEPWKRIKSTHEADRLAAQIACSQALEAFRVLTIFLRPILPALAAKAAAFLDVDENSLTWAALDAPLAEGHAIRRYEHLAARIDAKQVDAMIEASKESLASTPSPPNPSVEGKGSKVKASESEKKNVPVASSPAGTTASSISIDDFAKLDLRIGKVLACAFVDGSDKLLRFELDAGELGKRQIFSGIRAAYAEPEKLVGRHVVFIANLAPRKMRFGVSEGMILSAGSGGDQLFLLDVDSGAQAGMPVK